MPAATHAALLGGRSPAAFLHRHWQKEPLLVRRAIPDFRGIVAAPELFALACRDDVESRLVVRERGRWSLAQGPFRRSDFNAMPARDWTLLVQGVNLHLAAGDELLRRFAFIPYARLDDLMVSYAAPGGGVGPHTDSYDVFLLQGEGRRRWKVSRQRDLALKPGLPLKILVRFVPEDEWVLEPGDMLYLPPNYAHDGVAVDACTTYSIGFRAPAVQELALAFLDWLRDRVALEGRYADPDLAPSREPARIGAALGARFAAMLRELSWDRASVERFIGCYLTEPKPSVFFRPPSRPLSQAAFAAKAARSGVALDRRAQLLYDGRNLFINGEAAAWPGRSAPTVRRLANARRLAASEVKGAALLALLYRWYRDGFLHIC
jgi:50S ribosomal protein L16 3-hydroxylase